MEKVPFVDLQIQYESIKTELDDAIYTVIQNMSFIAGEQVRLFEVEYSKYLGIDYCITCANGTDSLEIILKALGVGVGDEVIVPALSWVSTSGCVTAVGARPIFVDIHKDLYTIDIDLIEEKITKKTKAIIPVHLYGQPVDMVRLMTMAKKYCLKVIEDCAQAHGAEFQGRKVGTFGHASSFSFYPGKNLGAYGDAGAMVTNDEDLAQKLKMIANHGQLEKHNHVIEGRNSRMDEIQAAILRVKLKHIDNWTTKRIENASLYFKLLQSHKLNLPKIIEGGKHVFHLFVVRTKNRRSVVKTMYSKNIEVAIHYPKALPFLQCYNYMEYSVEDFPVASKIQDEILSLPMFPELNKEQIKKVVKELKEESSRN